MLHQHPTAAQTQKKLHKLQTWTLKTCLKYSRLVFEFNYDRVKYYNSPTDTVISISFHRVNHVKLHGKHSLLSRSNLYSTSKQPSYVLYSFSLYSTIQIQHKTKIQ